MARVKYRDLRFGDEALGLVLEAARVCSEYGGQPLSVRQIYYRFVAGDLLPASWADAGGVKNTARSYKRLSQLLVRARYAGLLDWDLVEDRGRGAVGTAVQAGPAEALEAAAASFRLDRWRGQPYHVEVWCEKAALEGVLWPVAARWQVPYLSCRGYSSASAMRESAERIKRRCGGGRRPSVLYVGDLDPSGEDMVRDARDRLLEFGVPPSLEVVKVALTPEQVAHYKPPPCPLKTRGDGSLSDARGEAYRASHGDASWEADALPPDALARAVESALRARVDRAKMDAAAAEEAAGRRLLEEVARRVRERSR